MEALGQEHIAGGFEAVGVEGLALGIIEGRADATQLSPDVGPEEAHLALGVDVFQRHGAGGFEAVGTEGGTLGILEGRAGASQVAADVGPEEAHLALGVEAFGQEHGAGGFEAVGGYGSGTATEKVQAARPRVTQSYSIRYSAAD